MEMIGTTMFHFKILEKLLTEFLESNTPSGQAGEGGVCQSCLRSPQSRERGCDFEDPAVFLAGGMANTAREVKPYHPIAFEFLALEFT